MDVLAPVDPEMAVRDSSHYRQCRRCRQWFHPEAGALHPPWHWSRSSRSTHLLLGTEEHRLAFECAPCTRTRNWTRIGLLCLVVFGLPLVLMLLL